MKLKLVERDYEIFREVERWRFCLGRHIKVLAGFSGQRACDRRLRALLEAGYMDREKIVYGVPSVYRATYRAKMLIGANKRQDKIRLDNIPAASPVPRLAKRIVPGVIRALRFYPCGLVNQRGGYIVGLCRPSRLAREVRRRGACTAPAPSDCL